MMYYVLMYEREKPKFDAHISGILQNKEGQIIPSPFGMGKKLKTNETYLLTVDNEWSETGKKRDKLCVSAHKNNLFVVNQRLKMFLEEVAGNDLEFRSIFFENADITEHYFVVNIILKIDCVDYEQAELSFEEYDEDEQGFGNIYTIDSLVIDKNKTPYNKHIFLLARRQDAIIIVSEMFKKTISERSFTGFKFCEPENFSI
jgi:hypothetical protein